MYYEDTSCVLTIEKQQIIKGDQKESLKSDHVVYMEWMVITYLQRKEHSRNKGNFEYTKVNGGKIDIIFRRSFKRCAVCTRVVL